MGKKLSRQEFENLVTQDGKNNPVQLDQAQQKKMAAQEFQTLADSYSGSTTPNPGMESRPETQYYKGYLQAEGDFEKHLATNQPWYDEAGNAGVRFALNTIPGIIGNTAAALDFEDYFNKDAEIGNNITRAMEKLKEQVNEGVAPIYRKNNGQNRKPLDLGDSAWWWENGSMLAESATEFALLGYGLGSAMTKAAQASKWLGAMQSAETAYVAGKAMEGAGIFVNAAMLNQAESILSATQIYDQTYKEGIASGLSAEEAKLKAAAAGSHVVNTNRMNILLNLSSAAALMKGAKYTRQLVKEKGVLKPVFFEGAQEYAEETVNLYSENVGQAYGSHLVKGGTEENFEGRTADNFSKTIFSLEGLEAGILGFAGGAIQTAATAGLMKDQRRQIKDRAAAQQSEIKKLDDLRKTNKLSNLYEAGESLQQHTTLLAERNKIIQKLDQPGPVDSADLAKLKRIDRDLLSLQAYDHFNLGTTEILERQYQEIAMLTQEDAAKQGFTGDQLNEKSPVYYKTRAQEIAKTLQAYENIYNKYALGYINSKELFGIKSQEHDLKEDRKLLVKQIEEQKNITQEILNAIERPGLLWGISGALQLDDLTKKGYEQEVGNINDDRQITARKELIKQAKESEAYLRYTELNKLLEEHDKTITKITKLYAEKASVKTQEKLRNEVKQAEELIKKAQADEALENKKQQQAQAKSEKAATQTQVAKTDVKPKPEAPLKADTTNTLEILQSAVKKLNDSNKPPLTVQEEAAIKDPNYRELYEDLMAKEKENNRQAEAGAVAGQSSDPVLSNTGDPSNYTALSDKDITNLIKVIETENETEWTNLSREKRLTQANNVLAYLARNYERVLYVSPDGNTTQPGVADTSDELNQDLQDPRILDPKYLNVGDTIELKHDVDYAGFVYYEGKRVKWSDIQKNVQAQAYLDIVPISVRKNGVIVGYLHVPEWITPEKVQGDVEEDRKQLRAIRDHVIMHGDVKTTVTKRLNGKLIVAKDKVSLPVADAFKGGAEIKVMYNGNLVDSRNYAGDPSTIVINQHKLSEGVTYMVLPVNYNAEEKKNLSIAVPVRHSKLAQEEITSLSTVARIYMKAVSGIIPTEAEKAVARNILDLTEGIKVNGQRVNFNITTYQGAKNYFQLFTYSHNKDTTTNQTLKAYLASMGSATTALEVTPNGIDFGKGGGQEVVVGQFDFAKDATDYLNKLEAHLAETYHNVSLDFLKSNVPVPIVAADNTVTTKNGKYSDYLKQNVLSTIFRSINVGTEEAPNYVNSIQAVIEFDKGFVKGENPSIPSRYENPVEPGAMDISQSAVYAEDLYSALKGFMTEISAGASLGDVVADISVVYNKIQDVLKTNPNALPADKKSKLSGVQTFINTYNNVPSKPTKRSDIKFPEIKREEPKEVAAPVVKQSKKVTLLDLVGKTIEFEGYKGKVSHVVLKNNVYTAKFTDGTEKIISTSAEADDHFLLYQTGLKSDAPITINLENPESIQKAQREISGQLGDLDIRINTQSNDYLDSDIHTDSNLPGASLTEDQYKTLGFKFKVPGLSFKAQNSLVKFLAADINRKFVAGSVKDKQQTMGELLKPYRTGINKLYLDSVNNNAPHKGFELVLRHWDVIENMTGYLLQSLYNFSVNKEALGEILSEEEASLVIYGQNALEKDPKNTLSARFKRFLSDVEDPLEKNFLGRGEIMHYAEVYNHMSSILAGVEPVFNKMLEELNKHSATYPWINQVLDKLTKADSQIRNEFVVSFSKHYVNTKFAMFGVTKSGEADARILDDNSSSRIQVIKANWKNNLLSSSLVNKNFDTGAYQYSMDRVKGYIQDFDSITKENVRNFDIRKWLRGLGIEVHPKMIEDLKAHGYRPHPRAGFTNEYFSLFTNKNGLFKTLYTILKNIEKDPSGDVRESKLLSDNVITKLAVLNENYDTQTLTQSHRSGDRIIYSYTDNKFVVSRVQELKTNLELLNKLVTLPFSKHSYWLQQMLEFNDQTQSYNRDAAGNVIMKANAAAENFDISYLGLQVLKEKGALAPNKYTLEDLTSGEHEKAKLAFYFNKGLTSQGINLHQFFDLTLSNKGTMVSLTAPGMSIGMTDTGEPDSNTLDMLFDYTVVPEIARMLNYKPGHNINGYDKGANLFYFYPSLNQITELFNEDGTLVKDILQNKVLVEKIKAAVKQYIKDETDYKVQLWKDAGIVKYDDTGNLELTYIDNSYLKRLAGNSTSQMKNHLMRLAAMDMSVNYILANVNIFQLISTDPANYFKSSAQDKFQQALDTFDNIGKRLGGEISPGKDLSLEDNENESYVVGVVNDAALDSLGISDIEKLFENEPDLASKYKNIKATDAQEFTTVAEHIRVLYKSGKLTQEQWDKLSAKVASNNFKEFSPEELNLILQPMKPIQVGNKIDLTNNTERRFYIKSSSFPLIPQLVKGHELEKVLAIMDKQGIDRLVFQSAFKVGSVAKPATLFDKQGRVIDGVVLPTLELQRKYFRVQQEVPVKTSGEILRVSQASKLAFINLLDKEKFQNLEKKYLSAYDNLYTLSLDELGQELGFTVSAETWEIDPLKLKTLISKEVSSRSYPIQDLEALEINPETGEFNIPIWALNYSDRLESFLISIVKNRVIKQYMTGSSFVLGTEVGFKAFERTPDDGKKKKMSLEEFKAQRPELASKIIYTADFTGEIRPASQATEYFHEVLIPWKFKDLRMEDYLTAEGMLDESKFDRDLLKMFGMRIPNQGPNSTAAMKVVGFLPEEVGDLMIAPRDLVTQMGSDFDIDKIYAYMYSYFVNEKGKAKKLSATDPELQGYIEQKATSKLKSLLKNLLKSGLEEEAGKEFLVNKGIESYTINEIVNFIQKKLHQNTILDVHLAINTDPDPDIQRSIKRPLEYGELDKLAAEINQLSPSPVFKTLSPVSSSYQQQKYTNAASSSNSIGAFAVANTFNALVQGKDIELVIRDDEDKTVGMSTKFGSEVFDGNLSTKEAADGFKSDNISAFVSAAVDDEVQQILNKINVNDVTIPVITFLLQAGFSQQTIVYFINQEIIRDYVKEVKRLAERGSGFVANPQQVAMNKLLAMPKYQVLDIGNFIGSEQFERYQNMGKSDLRELLQGEAQGAADYKKKQVALLYKLDSLLNNQVKLLRHIQAAVNIDVNGPGGSIFESIIKQQDIESLPGLENVLNADTLIGDYIPITASVNPEELKTAGYIKGDYYWIKPSTIAGFAGVYGIIANNKIWNNPKYFPYSLPGVKNAMSEVVSFRNIQGSSSASRADKLSQAFKQLKHFLYTNSRSVEDLNVDRKQLLYDSKNNLSLATVYERVWQTEPIQSNKFLKLLAVRNPSDNTEPKILTIKNPFGDVFGDFEMYTAIVDALSRPKDLGNFNGIQYDTRLFIEHLFRAGFTSSRFTPALEILKYVPVKWLQATGMPDYFRNFDFGRLVNRTHHDLSVNSFTRQYFQHNPRQAPQVDIDISETKLNPALAPVYKKGKLVAYTVTDKSINVPTTKFVSFKDATSPIGYALFEKVTEGNYYVRINTLGTPMHMEYNFNQDYATSIVAENNTDNNPVVVINAPSEQASEPIMEPDDVQVEREAGTAAVMVHAETSREDILAKYGFDLNRTSKIFLGDEITNLYTEVIKNSENNATKTALEVLLPNLMHVPGFTVMQDTWIAEPGKTVLEGVLEDGTNKIIKAQLTVSINPKLANTKTAVEQVLIHESVHALTKLAIVAPANDRQRAARKRLQNLLDRYKEKYNIQGIDPLAPAPGKGFGDPVYDDYINLVYPAASIDEFLTGIWTSPQLRERLQALQYDEVGKISFWDELIKILQQVLRSFGIDADSTAGKAMLDSLVLMANQGSDHVFEQEESTSTFKNASEVLDSVGARRTSKGLLQVDGQHYYLDISKWTVIHKNGFDDLFINTEEGGEIYIGSRPTGTVNFKSEGGVKSSPTPVQADPLRQDPAAVNKPTWTPSLNYEGNFLPKNVEQENAIVDIRNFITSGNSKEWFTLEGKAGTGKTTLLQEAIRPYLNQSIGVAAIAHKAKRVLTDKLSAGGINVEGYSMAALLGMEMDLETGEFKPKKDFRGGDNRAPIEYLDIILIDECSMINEEALDLVMKLKKPKAKVIFSGDIGQLDPIRKEDTNKPSPTFETKNKAKLLTRVRQGEESPILPYADFYWNNSVLSTNPVKDPVDPFVRMNKLTDKGNLIFGKDIQSSLPSTLRAFQEGLAAGNPDRIRIVCYTNATRAAANKMVREGLYKSQYADGAIPEFVPGDILIMMDNFRLDEDTTVENSTEFVVKGAALSSDTFDDVKGKKINLPVYKVLVIFEGQPLSLEVPASAARPQFDKIVSDYFDAAKKLPAGFARTKAYAAAWAMKNRYAKLDYAYALTSHKSQGSTFETVVVSEDDIMSVGPTSNSNKSKSMYTAITRASKTAVVLSRTNPKQDPGKTTTITSESMIAGPANKPASPQQSARFIQLVDERQAVLNNYNKRLAEINLELANTQDARERVNLLKRRAKLEDKIDRAQQDLVDVKSAVQVEDLKTFAENDLDDISSLMVLGNSLSFAELDVISQKLKLWSNAVDNLYTESEKKSAQLKAVFRIGKPTDKYPLGIENTAKDLTEQLDQIKVNKLVSLTQNITNNKNLTEDLLFKAVTDISKLASETLDLSKAPLAILQTIAEYTKQVSTYAKEELITLGKQLQDLTTKAYETAYGKHNMGLDELFIEKDALGNRTGNLVLPYAPEYLTTKYNLYHTAKESDKRGDAKAWKAYFDFINDNEIEFDIRRLLKLPGYENFYDLEQQDGKHKAELINTLGQAEYDRRLSRAETLWKRYQTIRDAQEIMLNEDPNLTPDQQKKALEEWENMHSPAKYLDKKHNKHKTVNYGYKYLESIPLKTSKSGKPTAWYSKQFDIISGDPDLLALHQFMVKTLVDLRKYLPHDLQDDFRINTLPAMQKSVMEMFRTQGISAGMISMLDATKETMSSLDTGNIVYSDAQTQGRYLSPRVISLNDKIKERFEEKTKDATRVKGSALTQPEREQLYTEASAEITQENTFDIPKLIGAYASVVLSYKHKSKIEDAIRIAEEVFNTKAKEIKTNALGEPIFRNMAGNLVGVETTDGLKNYKEMLKYHLDKFFGVPQKIEGKTEGKVYTDRENKRKKKLEEQFAASTKIIEEATTELAAVEANTTLSTAAQTVKVGQLKAKITAELSTKQSIEGDLALLGRAVTGTGISELVHRYIYLKGLGWNMFSAFTNVGFGVISNMIEASGNQFYTQGQLMRAYRLTLHSVGKNYTFNQLETPAAKKIRTLMDDWDVLKKSSEELFRNKTLVTGKAAFLNAYNMQNRSEYVNQAPIMIAVMMNTKITTKAGEKSLWEIYGEDGTWDSTIHGDLDTVFSPTERAKFKSRLDKIIRNNHGNYDPAAPLKVKENILGRALSVFRTWMYEGFANRFEKEYTDEILGMERKGRYRSYGAGSLVLAGASLGTVILPGIGSGIGAGLGFVAGKFVPNKERRKDEFKDMSDFEELFYTTKQLLRKMIGKSTNFDERFTATDAANLRRNLTEINLLLALTAVFMLLKHMLDGDDDDESKYSLNTLINLSTRLQQDIGFYADPISFMHVIKNPLPATQVVTDSEKFVMAVAKAITGEDEIPTGSYAGQSRTGRAASELIPLWAQIKTMKDIGTQQFFGK